MNLQANFSKCLVFMLLVMILSYFSLGLIKMDFKITTEICKDT